MFSRKTKNQNVTFRDIEMSIKNRKIGKFHYSKCPVDISNIDADKTMISNKVSFGRKDLNVLLVTQMMKKLSNYV